MTKAKILPLSSRTDNSGARGIAAQFGINLGGMKSDDMYTAEMYPEILKSRSFLKRLLLLKFKTKDLGEKKLVSVIHEKDIKKSSKNFDSALSSGVNKLLKNNLTIKKTKMSPVIEIIVKTNEPGLSKSIGDSILSQLSLAINEYKLKKVNDRISFIKSRLFNVKQELNQTEENLNNFREKNRVVFNSPSLLLQEERLQRDVLLHNQIFTSLSTELETEQINQYGIKESFEILDYPENMGRVF